eukprot:scaffold2092_cov144-Amphora_coffeaeformis.AAC.5
MSQTNTVSIEIPPDAQVGDTLSFVLDGTTLELCVPEGAQPGDVLEVQLAASTEQLSSSVAEHHQKEESDKDHQNQDSLTNVSLWNGTSLSFFSELPEEEAAEEKSDGTYAHVWPAAKYFIENVLAVPTSLPILNDNEQYPKRVLELGSGTGVLGLSFSILLSERRRQHGPVALKRPLSSTNQAIEVVLSDCSAGIPLLRRNVEYNGDRIPSTVSVTCQALNWSEGRQVTADDVKYDMIVGSDLLYNIELLASLAETVNENLKENGLVLLSVRWRKPESERVFFQNTSNRGIDWSLLSTPKGCDLKWNEFGNPSSEASNTYFRQRTVAINGALHPLGEIDEAYMEQMTDEEHDAFEQSFLQVYLGRKTLTGTKIKRDHETCGDAGC